MSLLNIYVIIRSLVSQNMMIKFPMNGNFIIIFCETRDLIITYIFKSDIFTTLQVFPYACFVHFFIGCDIYRLFTESHRWVYQLLEFFCLYRVYTKEWCSFKSKQEIYFPPYTSTTYTVSSGNCPSFHALITILQCVHPESHDTHPHGNKIHPRLSEACPLSSDTRG